jgi:predicted small secreted protein
MTTSSLKTAAGLAALLMILGACETVKGIGRDIENTGEEIDRRVEVTSEDQDAA